MKIQTQSRLDWIDIYKGLAILMVVLGHAAPPFNGYIYSFHMAAFFFISGFATDFGKYPFWEFVRKRALTILVPYVSINLLFFLIQWSVSLTRWEEVFYSARLGDPTAAFRHLIGTNFYMGDMAGATWFLVVFFEAVVIGRLLVELDRLLDLRGVLMPVAAVIGLVYFYYVLLPGKRVLPLNMDLSLPAFFAVTAGNLARRLYFSGIGFPADRRGYAPLLWIGLGAISALILYRFPSPVNFPPRAFHSPFQDWFPALAGILLLFAASRLIEKIRFLNGFLVHTGRESLGLLQWHLFVMRISYAALYLFGLVPRQQLQALTLPPGTSLWGAVAVMATAGSLLIVWVIRRIPIVRSLLLGIQIPSAPRVSAGPGMSSRLELALRENRLLIGGVLVVGILTALPFLRAGIVTNDDLQYQVESAAGLGSFLSWSTKALSMQGRMLAQGYTLLRYASFLFTRDGVLFNVLTLFLSFGLLGWLVARLTRNRYAGWLTTLVLLLFMLDGWEPTPFVAFHGVFGSLFSLFLLSLLAFSYYLENGKKWLLAVSLLLYFIALCTYEVFIVYLPAYPFLVWWQCKFPLRTVVRQLPKRILPFAIPVGIYAILYLGFRQAFPSQYPGNSAINLDLPAILRANWLLVWHSNPLLDLARYPNYYASISGLQGYDFLRGFIAALLTPAILVRALIAAALVKICLDQVTTRARWGLLALVFLLFAGLPGLVVSATGYYQKAIINGMNRLPTTYFIYIALAGFAVCGALWLKTLWSLEAQKTVSLVLATAVLFASASLDYQNNLTADFQQQSQETWQAVDALMSSNLFKTMPDGATVYAPTLFQTIGSRAVHDTYWTQYFQVFAGKRVKVVRDLPADTDNLYYLRFDQDYLNDFQYALFSKVREARQGHLLGSRMLLAARAQGRAYRAVGSTWDAQADRPGPLQWATSDAAWPPLKNGYRGYPLYNQIYDLDSLFITPNLSESSAPRGASGTSLLTGEPISGFYDVSADGTWMAKEGVIRLNTGRTGRLVLDAFLPAYLLPNRITILSNGEVLIREEVTSGNLHYEIATGQPPDTMVEISIRMRRAPSALKAGAGTDNRELGLYILNLEFK